MAMAESSLGYTGEKDPGRSSLLRRRLRERIFAKPVIWSCFCKMARDQLDREVEEVMLVEAGAVGCNACQHGFS
jgi:hypothetical protein